MHHQVPWSFHYVWIQGWELYGIVYDFRYALYLANTHYYYFEFGRRLGMIIGKLIVLLDFVFDFQIITPTKPWNRFDPNYNPEG